MSAQRHSADSPPSEPNRRRRSSTSSLDDSPVTDGRTNDRLPLAYRIERVQLQIRTRALERELVASERQRQAIIDQYERLLQERSS